MFDERTDFVFKLLKQQKYLPTYDNVGKDASDAAFLVMQHAGSKYQTSLGFILSSMEQAVKKIKLHRIFMQCFVIDI